MDEVKKETVDMIISALCDRCGFNDWWYDLNEDIQEEIIKELVDTIP